MIFWNRGVWIFNISNISSINLLFLKEIAKFNATFVQYFLHSKLFNSTIKNVALFNLLYFLIEKTITIVALILM